MLLHANVRGQLVQEALDVGLEGLRNLSGRVLRIGRSMSEAKRVSNGRIGDFDSVFLREFGLQRIRAGVAEGTELLADIGV